MVKVDVFLRPSVRELEWTGLDWIRLDWTGMDWTGGLRDYWGGKDIYLVLDGKYSR